MSGLDKHLRKLRKSVISKRKHGSGRSRTACAYRADEHLKLASWRKVVILNIECDANYNKNSTVTWNVLKCSLNLIFVQIGNDFAELLLL